MSVLVMGISHRSAPVQLLEQAVLNGDELLKLMSDVFASPDVAGALALSTCNRMEVYVDAERFHPVVDAVTELMVRHTGLSVDILREHLYVHYEDRAVHHLFSVASGLDSMVVGETQILGQVRLALRAAQEQGTVGRALNDLLQQGLRVGKRIHAETAIDEVGASLLSVGLSLAEASLSGLDGRQALVVGAGSMASLAAGELQRQGLSVTVANRSFERGARLADHVRGRAVPLDELDDALVAADIVVTCTGSLGHVITASAVATAQRRRADRPLFILDVALPRDVDPGVLQVPGVTLADLGDLGEILSGGDYDTAVDDVRRIVAEEVQLFLTSRLIDHVAPTVVALRSMATDVVDAEMARFAARNPAADASTREEVARTLRRVVDKLMHGPTVRVKELAGRPDGDAYAAALNVLFDLDRGAAESVSRVDLPDGPA